MGNLYINIYIYNFFSDVHNNSYLADYSIYGDLKFNTLYDSLIASHSDINSGGVTYENGFYTVRYGKQLIKTKLSSKSWIKNSNNDISNINISTNSNIYDFIEIGTSDFDTEIQKCTTDSNGILIEPCIEYLTRLPPKANVKKLNYAISDYNGYIDFYHIPSSIISELKLPIWTKGCNSVNSYHPTVLKLLLDKGLQPEKYFVKTTVKTITLYSCLLEQNVEQINLLKIDTEGHDCIILKKFSEEIISNSRYDLLPKMIKFESNSLTEIESVNEIKNIYKKFNYIVTFSAGDTVLMKNK